MADWRKDMIRDRAASLSRPEAGSVLPEAAPLSGLDDTSLITSPLSEISKHFQTVQAAHAGDEPLFFASAQGGQVHSEWLQFATAFNAQVVSEERISVPEGQVDITALDAAGQRLSDKPEAPALHQSHHKPLSLFHPKPGVS